MNTQDFMIELETEKKAWLIELQGSIIRECESVNFEEDQTAYAVELFDKGCRRGIVPIDAYDYVMDTIAHGIDC